MWDVRLKECCQTKTFVIIKKALSLNLAVSQQLRNLLLDLLLFFSRHLLFDGFSVVGSLDKRQERQYLPDFRSLLGDWVSHTPNQE